MPSCVACRVILRIFWYNDLFHSWKTINPIGRRTLCGFCACLISSRFLSVTGWMSEWMIEWMGYRTIRDKVRPCTSFLTVLHPNLKLFIHPECPQNVSSIPHPSRLLPSGIPHDTLLGFHHHSSAGLEWFPDFETCPPSEFLGISARVFHSVKMFYSTSSSWIFNTSFRPLPACHFLNGCFTKSCKTRSPWNPLSYIESCISL